MDEAAGLRADGIGQAWVPVTEDAHGHTGRHVEETTARDVPQEAALAARHDDGRLSIVVEEQAFARVDALVLV